jgi:adenosylcobinamide amidohydrolase
MGIKDTMADVLELVDPDSQAILRDMLTRAGFNEQVTVGEMLNRFVPENDSPKEERMALLHVMGVDKNKFAPKMTRDQRCQVLALHRMGIKPEVLGKMFNVDRRTVTHIYTEASPHYKAIREEEAAIGRAAFNGKYLTYETINTALAFNHQLSTTAVTNNKFAKGKAGIHTVNSKNCAYAHRVIIAWQDVNSDLNIDTEGWYYRDLDSDFPDTWFSVGEESMRTSMACYIAMLDDITDKL